MIRVNGLSDFRYVDKQAAEPRQSCWRGEVDFVEFGTALAIRFW
jgi:hypothetical protein